MSATYGSLFSGVGLLDLGVEMAFRDAGIPIECGWQVEINPFSRAVLMKHWPEVPKYEDVTRVGTTGFALTPVDLIVGGFPCQDVSTAGKGRGLRGGARSWLWFEFLRIIRELRPRAVIVENVLGLIRGGLDDVVTGLTDAGYAVEATRIRASDLRATHRRERVFIVANAKSLLGNGRHDYVGSRSLSARKVQNVSKPGDGLCADRAGPGGETDLTGLGRSPYGRTPWLDGHRWPAPQGPQHEWEPPRTEGDAANRAARLKALGNAVVPQCAYIATMRVIERMGEP